MLCCNSSSCRQVLSGEQVQKGFGRLVESLDDLLLDVPDAVELLSLFIARGVVGSLCCGIRQHFGVFCMSQCCKHVLLAHIAGQLKQQMTAQHNPGSRLLTHSFSEQWPHAR
jgi:hypothetical protein